jgi:hypothetical protein
VNTTFLKPEMFPCAGRRQTRHQPSPHTFESRKIGLDEKGSSNGARWVQWLELIRITGPGTIFLCKQIIVTKSKELKAGSIWLDILMRTSVKKRAIFPIIMII